MTRKWWSSGAENLADIRGTADWFRIREQGRWRAQEYFAARYYCDYWLVNENLLADGCCTCTGDLYLLTIVGRDITQVVSVLKRKTEKSTGSVRTNAWFFFFKIINTSIGHIQSV